MSLDKVIESQIQDAIAAAAFDNLAGAGKPLPFTEHEKMAGENWLGFKILQNGGMVPQWLGLAQDIEGASSKYEDRVAPLATHTYPLEQAAAAFETALNKGSGGIMVTVLP